MKTLKIIKPTKPLNKKIHIKSKLKEKRIPLKLFKATHPINFVNKIDNL